MQYNVTDSNVTSYLEELKNIVFTLGTSSDTGTLNLKQLVVFIQNNITDITRRSNEHRIFLSARYSKVNAILNSLEDTTKTANNLDLRYSFHKSMQNSIKTFSGFMKVINLHIDTDLSVYSQQISEYRRELNNITNLLVQIDKQITYLEEISAQLPQLIVLCETT